MSELYKGICAIHQMQTIAIDLNSLTPKEQKKLCAKCMSISCSALLNNEFSSITSELKLKEYKQQKQEYESKLENYQQLCITLKDYSNFVNEFINKILSQINNQIEKQRIVSPIFLSNKIKQVKMIQYCQYNLKLKANKFSQFPILKLILRVKENSSLQYRINYRNCNLLNHIMKSCVRCKNYQIINIQKKKLNKKSSKQKIILNHREVLFQSIIAASMGKRLLFSLEMRISKMKGFFVSTAFLNSNIIQQLQKKLIRFG